MKSKLSSRLTDLQILATFLESKNINTDEILKDGLNDDISAEFVWKIGEVDINCHLQETGKNSYDFNIWFDFSEADSGAVLSFVENTDFNGPMKFVVGSMENYIRGSVCDFVLGTRTNVEALAKAVGVE
jgi:hypothetical protein